MVVSRANRKPVLHRPPELAALTGEVPHRTKSPRSPIWEKANVEALKGVINRFKGCSFINSSGVRASCGQCHVPYDSGHATAMEYMKMLIYKAQRGAEDFWNESRKTNDDFRFWVAQLHGCRQQSQRPRLPSVSPEWGYIYPHEREYL